MILNQTLPDFDWRVACAEKRQRDTSRIPIGWRLPGNIALDSDVTGIPSTCGILSAKEVEITELDDVDELLKKLKLGVWSSEEVTRAFCKRAAIAHQLTNCLSEFWFNEAINAGKERDAALLDGGPVGPLHGLPISLKDQFQIKGTECNMGWASWIGNISKENSVLVDCLESAGAVIFARTNIAQALWFGEGDNHVYGRVDNPFNRAKVSGGSSAGEGPLGALRGSPLGVGTDIGGSIRYPSMFCGLYGLRATTKRLPYAKALNSVMGFESIESSIGPMCSNLSGCVSFLRGVLATSPHDRDATVVPIPWNESQYRLEHIGGPQARLTFGYYDFDGAVHCHPPIKRALAMVVESLKKAGHEVIPWKYTKSEEVAHVTARLFDADGGEDLKAVVRNTGETILPQVLVGKLPGMSSFELNQMNRRKQALRQEMIEQWVSTASKTTTGRPIDAIICPCVPYAAPAHGKTEAVSYTATYNMLDWPSIAVPVTTVDPSIDPVDPGYEPVSAQDQAVRDLYDPVGSSGLPVGVQLVGRRFQEEELLGVTGLMVEALRAGLC